MGDQPIEAELQIFTGERCAHHFAVHAAVERQVQAMVPPCVAQLSRGHRHRRIRIGRLAVHEAEALGELVGDEIAQRHIVDQHQQLDMSAGGRCRHAHGYIVGDDRYLGLEIHTPGLVTGEDRIPGANRAVRAALIHEGIGKHLRRHVRAPGPAHPLQMTEVGAGVEPLIGTRERCCQIPRVEGEANSRIGVEGAVNVLESLRDPRPVVQGGLQRGRDIRHGDGALQTAVHDHERSVAAAGLERPELHPPSDFQLST